MPNTGNNSGINAKRFAALLAGFDTGNPSEEEALAKGRALRRMAADMGLRVVDVMELPDVKQAIDDQMRPKRQENPALRRALEQVLSLQNELTERTRNARQLADDEMIAFVEGVRCGPVKAKRKPYWKVFPPYAYRRNPYAGKKNGLWEWLFG